jgi:pyruvate formate lyase activating enzyme
MTLRGEPGDVAGWIFDLQRFSIHDGPGIRTTVFLKGCPLRCRWCHNPEGVSPRPQLSFMPDRCIGCGRCLKVCPQGAHQVAEGRHWLLREKCLVCGACAAECHAKALEIVGRQVTVREVLDEVLRDRPVYETSHGGMTLSGGEPTMQIEFAEALLREAKGQGLHTCIETSGASEWERLERLRPWVDLWLFDWKETDPARHRELTGVSNERIAGNLRRLDGAGAAIVLRCPIVPGLNDRDDHFAGIARLAGELRHVLGVELTPYHRLGEGKLKRFGLEDSDRASAEAPKPEQVEEWKRKVGAKVVSP